MSARRRFTGPPNRYRGPQYASILARLNFERGVKGQFADLSTATVRPTAKVPGGYRVQRHRASSALRGTKDPYSIQGYDRTCLLSLRMVHRSHRTATRNNSLCMWFPEDPIDCRWVFEDGLLNLIGLAMAHLFREAWWRETGEWAGEEVGHGLEARNDSRCD